ncbi:MAG: VapC toxin family PIN domain ribonuclease [Gammaproteobacteria bacterium]|nr:MAG: VapC toxin family PIN domain ribonuclease [Gammaproteobacteria bacterium]TVS19641.1 MAG: VapC toxin family PIN domain ribonuclease [Gammaproteobacteria bacterium]
MLKCLLDTNIAIYTIKNRPSEVREAFKAHEVLPYDREAAAQTSQLRAELKKAGRPIGPYDEMIAGHARAKGLVVVTNNMKQFENLPGLRLENWA